MRSLFSLFLGAASRGREIDEEGDNEIATLLALRVCDGSHRPLAWLPRPEGERISVRTVQPSRRPYCA